MQALVFTLCVFSSQALRFSPNRALSSKESEVAMERNNANLIAKEILQAEKTVKFDTDGNEYGKSSEEIIAQKSVLPELMPRDFKENRKLTERVWRDLTSKKGGDSVFGGGELTSFETGTLYAAYGLCVLIIAGVLALMYWNRGLASVTAILAYVAALSTMSVMIRGIYVTHSFGFPQFITSMHGATTCLVGYCILQHRRQTTGQKITVPTMNTLLFGMGPVALTFALSLGCSNLSLLHGNAHFFETMSALNIPVTFSMGFLLGRPTQPRLLAPLLLVTFAIAVVAFGEVKWSSLGAFFVLAGVFFNACKANLQALLMTRGAMFQHFDPPELVFWSSMISTVIMLCWSAFAEGLTPWKQFSTSGVVMAVGISCVNAAVLNTSGLFVMKEVGPVAQQIIGQIKGVLACLGAVAAFSEVMTLQPIVGYAFVIIGAQWYNMTQMAVEEEKKADAYSMKLAETTMNTQNAQKA